MRSPTATVGIPVLLRRYRRCGDRAAREQLVQLMVPLVDAMAGRYRASGDPDELRQAASLGLAKAIERFDPRYGVPLRVYAARTMRGEVLRHLRDTSWAVRPPRPLQERMLAVLRTADDFACSRGRRPRPSELADELGLSVEEVLEAQEAAQAHRAVSLDAPRDRHDSEAGTLADVLGEEDGRLAHAEQLADLRGLGGRLTDNERLVLGLRFVHECSQREIAERTALSEGQVRRTLGEALAQLQQAVGSASEQPTARRAAPTAP